MTVQISEKKLSLIEELGIHFEQSGMQPAASRILALLMVSDRYELTFEEIYETLNISKSAASNAINLLLNTFRIEYITRSGERKRYFRCKIKSLKQDIQRAVLSLDVFCSLVKKILAERNIDTKDFNEGLEELVGFLEFMKVELPALFEKWESQKQ